jgi:hypothetical protein
MVVVVVCWAKENQQTRLNDSLGVILVVFRAKKTAQRVLKTSLQGIHIAACSLA